MVTGWVCCVMVTGWVCCVMVTGWVCCVMVTGWVCCVMVTGWVCCAYASVPPLSWTCSSRCVSLWTQGQGIGGGGGLRGGGEDRATLGECNSISALAQCFGLAGQGTSFISSAVEPVWRGWQMGIETENRRCSWSQNVGWELFLLVLEAEV